MLCKFAYLSENMSPVMSCSFYFSYRNSQLVLQLWYINVEARCQKLPQLSLLKLDFQHGHVQDHCFQTSGCNKRVTCHPHYDIDLLAVLGYCNTTNDLGERQHLLSLGRLWRHPKSLSFLLLQSYFQLVSLQFLKIISDFSRFMLACVFNKNDLFFHIKSPAV